MNRRIPLEQDQAMETVTGLKLEATAGSGQTTATGATSSADAASVGLRYQFEY